MYLTIRLLQNLIFPSLGILESVILWLEAHLSSAARNLCNSKRRMQYQMSPGGQKQELRRNSVTGET